MLLSDTILIQAHHKIILNCCCMLSNTSNTTDLRHNHTTKQNITEIRLGLSADEAFQNWFLTSGDQ